MRIWHQSYSDLRELPGYVSWLTAHAFEVLPEARVDVHGLRPTGADPMTPEGKAPALVDAARTARDRGYDAMVLGCIYDPALAECRAAVDIPVVGLAEATTGLRGHEAVKLGLLVLAPEEIEIVESLMTSYGLTDREFRVSPVTPEISESDLDAAGRRCDWSVVDDTARATEDLVDQGFARVVAAEGVLNEYLWAARKAGVNARVHDSVGWAWGRARDAVVARPQTQARPSEGPVHAGPVEWFAPELIPQVF